MPSDDPVQVATIRRLGEHVGRNVRLRGWLYNKRSKGKLHFLQVRDGTGICQAVVFRDDVVPETFAEADRITQESSLELEGAVRADARAPGGFEISVSALRIVHLARDYPIAKKEHGPDFLLSNRHLWLRSRLQWAKLRVRHTVVRAIRDFFDSRDFVLVDAPIFTPAACEGTTTLFEVKYFEDEKAYLTQSGQLYMEAAAMAFGKVYCFGPTFRAEKSKTRRHLTEFWMVEPEVAYCDLNGVMELAEQLVSAIVARVLGVNREELKILERDTAPLEKISPPFPRLKYDDAVRFLNGKGLPFQWGGDFGAPDEAAISNSFDRPVMVHRYPAAVKAFYMKRDPEDERLALCVDVLAPEGTGEIIGGGQREDSLEKLEAAIAAHNLPRQAFEWYLDLRRYGSVPHGGFGLGVERTVAWLTGTEHVRECIPFPRMLYRIYP
ncbi:MAG: asparagine--tRNA ligase [Planctomycetota bacterium]|nr:asparagine--tRNA ligase [Planctomycetota bacterium]